MSIPTDRKYLKSHEWHKQDGDVVVIGITQIAADELTDITYVSLPKEGTKVSANTRFGEIESLPSGMPRVSATSLFTFAAGRMPPLPGFAPCASLISIILISECAATRSFSF